MKRLFALVLVAFAACNAPPAAPTVSVSPANPRTDADLKANIVAASADPQGDAVTYSFAWLKDGAPQVDLVTDTVPAARTVRGEVWSVVVTPSDGKLSGPTAQAQVTVANTPPTATLAFVPPDPVKGTPLKVVATGADADGDAVTFAYAWTKNGTATAFITDTVPASELARGQAWQVTVTPNDGTDAGTPVSAGVTVGNAKPVVASVSLSPEAPTKATPLAAQPAAPTDEDGDTVTLKYAWSVNGAVVDGQTGPGLPASFFQKGQVVTVSVTPNDGKEDGVAVSASATIGNAAPTSPAVIITADPTDASDVSCTVAVQSADLDTTDTVSYQFTWTKNSQPFVGASNQGSFSVVPAALTSDGDVFTCVVSATDGTAITQGNTVTTLVHGPYLSCMSALALKPSATDGWYDIDPDGVGPEASKKVYCDMINGGWARVSDVDLGSGLPPNTQKSNFANCNTQGSGTVAGRVAWVQRDMDNNIWIPMSGVVPGASWAISAEYYVASLDQRVAISFPTAGNGSYPTGSFGPAIGIVTNGNGTAFGYNLNPLSVYLSDAVSSQEVPNAAVLGKWTSVRIEADADSGWVTYQLDGAVIGHRAYSPASLMPNNYLNLGGNGTCSSEYAWGRVQGFVR